MPELALDAAQQAAAADCLRRRLIGALDGPAGKVVEFVTRIIRITVTGLALEETAV